MALSIEIKEEESCDCCGNCKMGSMGAAPAGPAEKPKTKEELLTELKKLLGQQGTQGGTTQAERQVLIDDVIDQLDDLADMAESSDD
jgi:hypothetical protein